MENKTVFLTEAGRERVLKELDHLRNVKRPEVAAKIQRSSELESTVNNAEYDDAKNEQAFVEGRILTLEAVLHSATIVRHETSGVIEVGSTVKLLTQDGEQESYTIVGSVEADAAEGRISNESPVGRALLDKRVGDNVEITVPAGKLTMKIVEIA